jgi:hypothetical protein
MGDFDYLGDRGFINMRGAASFSSRMRMRTVSDRTR